MAVNQCGLPLHLHLHPGAAASTAVSEANLLADSLGVSPLYRQQESARWQSAASLYHNQQQQSSQSVLFEDGVSTVSTPEHQNHQFSTTNPFLTPSTSSKGNFFSTPVSLIEVASRNRSHAGSSGHLPLGADTLELEAIAAVHELAYAVQSIAVSEILPRTSDLFFVNVKTFEGHFYCLELTMKGWRVASLRHDCMNGDYTKISLHITYYASLYELLDAISPGYREQFTQQVSQKLRQLKVDETSAMSIDEDFDTSTTDECSKIERTKSFCAPKTPTTSPSASMLDLSECDEKKL